MLKEKWEVIYQVIIDTLGHFEINIDFIDRLEKMCLKMIEESNQLIVKLDNELFLRFSPYVSNKLKIKLIAKDKGYLEKSEWERAMKKLFTDDTKLYFTASGLLLSSEPFVDLPVFIEARQETDLLIEAGGLVPVVEASEDEKNVIEAMVDVADDAFENALEHTPTDEPEDESLVAVAEAADKAFDEAINNSVCPNCGTPIEDIDSDNENTCPECENTYWLCPRCNELIEEDPNDEETTECPLCENSLAEVVACPHCHHDIWVDLDKCPKCGKELEKSQCPHCHKELVKTELDECPYCQETLWDCPRCGGYLDEDPNELNECPCCEESLAKISCPHCHHDIWADLDACPDCGQELKKSECPHCEKELIVNKDLEECPYCDENIYLCPRCNVYIDQDPDDDDTEACPRCEELLVTFTCPDCDWGGIFVDTTNCPGCGNEFTFEQCPDCGKEIPSGLDECPFCSENLEITTCPFCDKKHYIGED